MKETPRRRALRFRCRRALPIEMACSRFDPLGCAGVARLRKLWGDGGYRGEAIVMPEIMRC